MKTLLSLILVGMSWAVWAEEEASSPKLSLAEGAMEDLYRVGRELRGRLYRASLSERMEIQSELRALEKRVRMQEKLLGKEAPLLPKAKTPSRMITQGASPWMPQEREGQVMVWGEQQRPTPMAWWPDAWKIRMPGPPPSKERVRRKDEPILESEIIAYEGFDEPMAREKVVKKKKAMLKLLSLHPRQVLQTRQILFGVPQEFRAKGWHLWEKRGQGDWAYLTEGKGDRNFSFEFEEDLPLRYTFTTRRHQPDPRDPGMYYFILDTQRPKALNLSRRVGEYGLTQLNWHFEDINLGVRPVTLRLLNSVGGVVAMESGLPGKGHHIMSSQQSKDSVIAEWSVRDEAGNLTERVLPLQ